METGKLMDTVEELQGTYSYAGKSNLTASELFFMIFCENMVYQVGIGVADFAAAVATVVFASSIIGSTSDADFAAADIDPAAGVGFDDDTAAAVVGSAVAAKYSVGGGVVDSQIVVPRNLVVVVRV